MRDTPPRPKLPLFPYPHISLGGLAVPETGSLCAERYIPRVNQSDWSPTTPTRWNNHCGLTVPGSTVRGAAWPYPRGRGWSNRSLSIDPGNQQPLAAVMKWRHFALLLGIRTLRMSVLVRYVEESAVPASGRAVRAQERAHAA